MTDGRVDRRRELEAILISALDFDNQRLHLQSAVHKTWVAWQDLRLEMRGHAGDLIVIDLDFRLTTRCLSRGISRRSVCTLTIRVAATKFFRSVPSPTARNVLLRIAS